MYQTTNCVIVETIPGKYLHNYFFKKYNDCFSLVEKDINREITSGYETEEFGLVETNLLKQKDTLKTTNYDNKTIETFVDSLNFVWTIKINSIL